MTIIYSVDGTTITDRLPDDHGEHWVQDTPDTGHFEPADLAHGYYPLVKVAPPVPNDHLKTTERVGDEFVEVWTFDQARQDARLEGETQQVNQTDIETKLRNDIAVLKQQIIDLQVDIDTLVVSIADETADRDQADLDIVAEQANRDAADVDIAAADAEIAAQQVIIDGGGPPDPKRDARIAQNAAKVDRALAVQDRATAVTRIRLARAEKQHAVGMLGIDRMMKDQKRDTLQQARGDNRLTRIVIGSDLLDDTEGT